MNNYNVVLLGGGYYRCTPEWNSNPNGKDKFFKIYFPVEGSARLLSSGVWHEIKAGNVYFIDGNRLDKYECDEFMNVYWLHFIPESQFLNMYLAKLDSVYCLKQGTLPLRVDLDKIPLLFDRPGMRENKLLDNSSLSHICYVNSLILLLTSELLEKQGNSIDKVSYEIYKKLEPALEFVKNNYKSNLKLENIAQCSFLNPIYFLRLFKKGLNTTPNNYLKMLRLNEACKLLLKSDMSIKEVAENSGFCNQFYFSKVFKNHFNKTPMEYRNTKISP